MIQSQKKDSLNLEVRKYKPGQVLMLGNIVELVSDDLVNLVKSHSTEEQRSIQTLEKWQGIGHTLYKFDEMTKYSPDLHEIHSIYSKNGLDIDIDEYAKSHLERLKPYPANIKFDMDLTTNTQQILDFLEIDYAIIKTTRQPPGALYPIHYDKMHSLSELSGGENQTVLRFYIFLEDWKQGQFLFANDSVLQWKKGDIYCWDNNVLHGSANSGIHPKMGLTITGPLKLDNGKVK